MPIIQMEQVYKEFKIKNRTKGIAQTTKSLFHPEYTVKKAVEDVTFSIEKGELVGYIGPNGAGKSTTIKMLTGILQPTQGHVFVNGVNPSKNRRENAMNIGVVFGQRSQLYWDLPLSEALSLYRKMYHVEQQKFDKNVAYFTELLEMGEFIDRPIRQLSLGEKMRAELTVALLHDPQIVYLDEPTIGLDVLAKKRIRGFINEINRKRQTTVILTTHDMEDIEQVCNRLILIDKGKLLFDGSLERFKSFYSGETIVDFTFSESKGEKLAFHGLQYLTPLDEGHMLLGFDNQETNTVEVISHLAKNFTLYNFTVKEPRLDEILQKIYEKDS